jgi:hypothetical protein
MNNESATAGMPLTLRMPEIEGMPATDTGTPERKGYHQQF